LRCKNIERGPYGGLAFLSFGINYLIDPAVVESQRVAHIF
jgi:hypothetical protein